MKKFTIIILVIFLKLSIFAFDFIHYNVENEKLQSNVVYDVFFYDTSQDNISDEWRSDISKSWYQEPSNPSDDFTGTELDDNRWQQIGTPDYDDWADLSGRANAYTHIGDGIESYTKWELSGTFVIQISFKDFACDNDGELRFAIVNVNNHEQQYSVARKRTATGTDVYINNETGYEIPMDDTEGKLQIIRYNSFCSVSYSEWDEENGWIWNQIGEVSDFGDFDVFPAIYHYGGYQNDIEVKIDDFILLSGTTTFGNHGSVVRGTTNEFPEQAILVATDTGLDIIDASDNDLWMRFKNFDHTRDTGQNQNMVADTLHTVFALDGRIYCGAYNGFMLGVGVIDFIQDKSWFYDAHENPAPHGTGWDCFADISQRNKHRGWTDHERTYVQLLGYSVYDIQAKVIDNGREEKSYLAIANGQCNSEIETEKYGTAVVINIDDNTKSYDKTGYLRPITSIEISEEQKLYYLEFYKVYVENSDYLDEGEFNYDHRANYSLSGGVSPSDMVTTNSFVYLSDQDDDPNETSGSTDKHNLDDCSYTGIKYTNGGFPTIRLWGSASCSALETNNNALWVATNHYEQGRIYIIGAESPLQDAIRGEFNLPSPLNSGNITSLSFGEASDFAENLLVGYENNGVTRLFGAENTLSLNNLVEGTIQHNFSYLPGFKDDPFTFHFNDAYITLDNYDYASNDEYGNVELTLHRQDPVFPAPEFPHPEHTLDLWYNIKSQEGFDAFPCEINLEFTSPVPAGNDNLQLWNFLEGGQEWIPDHLDEEVTVNWNFVSSPYSVNYTTYHFSPWAMNNGGGGALSYPPLMPENLTINKSESDVTLNWDEVTLDTGSYPISGVTYNIYSADDPYSEWILEDSGVIESIWINTVSEVKKFYKITAVYIPQVE